MRCSSETKHAKSVTPSRTWARRSGWALFALALALKSSCVTSNGSIGVPLSEHVTPGDVFMGIRLLGTLRLPSSPVDGIAFNAISGLAWDEDEQLLYAISDRGYLFHLRPIIVNGRLVDVERVAGFRLTNRDGKALKSPWQDAEGLTITGAANGHPGDSELIISFEIRPRISKFTPFGRWLGTFELPRILRNRRNYHNANSSLEAITIDSRFGPVVALERPMRGQRANHVGWFAISENQAVWQYPLGPAAGSSLVAIEALSDGSVLTLERAFVGLTRPLVISLRLTELTDGQSQLSVTDKAIFDTSQGWLLDNFEGLTHQRDRRFFLASDDNENLLQSTLLVYFELL